MDENETEFVVNELKKKISELVSKMDQVVLVTWACDCANHLLSLFEDKFPNDNRPREAIEAARAWVDGKVKVSKVRSASLAAHAAARDAKAMGEENACFAARVAGHAAAIVHVARHAKGVTFYAAKINQKELVWQYEKLLEIKNKKVKM